MHWSIWVASAVHNKGDIVRISNTKSNQYLQCIAITGDATSGTAEPTANVTGTQITDNNVTWLVKEIGAGDSSNGIHIWVSGKFFESGQAVIYNNVLFRCKTDHTSGVTFDVDISYWQEIKASISLWNTNVYYLLDDLVISNNIIYICTTPHTSTTFDADLGNWEIIGSFGLVDDFKIDKLYEVGQLVLNGSLLYKNTVRHTSSNSGFLCIS